MAPQPLIHQHQGLVALQLCHLHAESGREGASCTDSERALRLAAALAAVHAARPVPPTHPGLVKGGCRALLLVVQHQPRIVQQLYAPGATGRGRVALTVAGRQRQAGARKGPTRQLAGRR